MCRVNRIPRLVFVVLPSCVTAAFPQIFSVFVVLRWMHCAFVSGPRRAREGRQAWMQKVIVGCTMHRFHQLQRIIHVEGCAYGEKLIASG